MRDVQYMHACVLLEFKGRVHRRVKAPASLPRCTCTCACMHAELAGGAPYRNVPHACRAGWLQVLLLLSECTAAAGAHCTSALCTAPHACLCSAQGGAMAQQPGCTALRMGAIHDGVTCRPCMAMWSIQSVTESRL